MVGNGDRLFSLRHVLGDGFRFIGAYSAVFRSNVSGLSSCLCQQRQRWQADNIYHNAGGSNPSDLAWTLASLNGVLTFIPDAGDDPNHIPIGLLPPTAKTDPS